MFVSPETDSEIRRKQINRDVEKERREHEDAKKNSKFTQVSPKGWERVRELLMDKQGISALKLYSFLAEHIDPSCGAVVADQQFLADKMDVSRTTIIRWLNYLESKNALVRIPVAGKVCAYALDPHEVWKGYNTTKDYAAFRTKTLVNTDGDIKRRIMAMFSGTESGQEQKRSDS
ncbi:helix-turn-helix domain-containing protein [Salmonella enterica]|nr:helix-turn-helix domain-containing protein [Salmonella enterica subsp. enterica serovar Muenchen]EEN2158480.1 helix-turn-helix domain-containing protein [Salmonella enterica]OIN30326.1 RepA plasmid replication protein [Salmonella enterica subsp. enterica serovar Sarajane]EDO6080476.1 helix-turn-helix domain-containing protein [Salmonella enterica subsp. enterica serovar Muenchen]EEB9065170.1 helix-turn-helix domain-containing protein [Salmonella enterica subsp. enterica serovar Muenchen]